MKKAESFDGYEGKIIAEVTRIENKDYYSKLTLKAKAIGEERVNVKIRTTVSDTQHEFIEGDIVEFYGTLSKNFPNTILYDGKRASASDKIFLTMKTDSATKTELPPNPFRNAVYKFRTSTEDDISGLNNSSLISEVLLGSGNVDAQTNKVFQSLGLSHALAVSGMHLSILVMTFYYALRQYPLGKHLISFICVMLTLFYMALTGFTFSILRAGIMMTAYFLSITIRRLSDSLTTLFASALFITAFNPWSFYSIGFQLSFLATLGIITFCPVVIKAVKDSRLFTLTPKTKNIVLKTIVHLSKRVLLSIILAAINTISATIATLPLTLLYFNSFTLFSIISNITVLFIINLLLGCSIIYSIICLTNLVPLIKLFGFICNAVSDAVMVSSDFLHSVFPDPFRFTPEESVLTALILCAVIIISIIFFKKPHHLIYISLAIAFCTVTSVFIVNLNSEKNYYVTFSTTESCRDILVETSGETVLFSPHADSYSFKALSDMLSWRNIHTIDSATFVTDKSIPIDKISRLCEKADIKKLTIISIDGSIPSKEKRKLEEILPSDCTCEYSNKRKLDITESLSFTSSRNRYYSYTVNDNDSELIFLYCLNKTAIMTYSQLNEAEGVVIYSSRKNYPNLSCEGYYFCESPSNLRSGNITDDTENFDFGFVKLKNGKIKVTQY